MDLKKTSCDVGMHFRKLRDNLEKIGNYRTFFYAFRKTSVAFRLRSSWWRPLRECIRRFPERHKQLFIFCYMYVYRSLPTSHGDCRGPLYPCYVKILSFKSCLRTFGEHCTCRRTHLLWYLVCYSLFISFATKGVGSVTIQNGLFFL